MWNQPGLGNRAIFKLELEKDPPTLDMAGLAGITYHTLRDLTLQDEVFVFLTFGCAGSCYAQVLSLVEESRGYFLLWGVGFSLQWLLLWWSTGLVAPWRMKSSRIKD